MAKECINCESNTGRCFLFEALQWIGKRMHQPGIEHTGNRTLGIVTILLWTKLLNTQEDGFIFYEVCKFEQLCIKNKYWSLIFILQMIKDYDYSYTKKYK